MGEIKAPSPESSAPRRPWYRLHLSTWLVFFFTVGILILLIVPGETDGHHTAFGDSLTEGSFIMDGEFFHHGWPWEYLMRYVEGSGLNSSREELENAPWMILRGWSFCGNGCTFSPLYLFCDLLVCVLILILISTVFEWRRRRHIRVYQFTLRELIVVMLIVAGICSWWETNHLRRKKEQDILLLGEQIPDASFDDEYRGPAVLHKLIGKNYLDDFYAINSFSYEYHSNMKSIIQGVEDEPMAQNVNKLFLLVSEMKYIESIVIESDIATDKDLENISLLPNLQELSLHSSRITDFGMPLISHLKKLNTLDLSSTEITSKSICNLELLDNLEKLNLSETQIDDEAVPILYNLKNLKILNLKWTNITDNSIISLGKLSKLEKLNIDPSKITPQSFQKLQALLPSCEISYESDIVPTNAFPPESGMF